MAQIDEVISPAEQKRWLSDSQYQMDWGQPAYPPENRVMAPDKMELFLEFISYPQLLPIVEFLQHYIPNCLPYFRRTERDFWAISIATSYGPILAINGIQTLFDVFEHKGDLVFRWYLFEENLHNAFGENAERLVDEYPLASYEQSGLVAAGSNQIQLFTWSEDAIRLCHDASFIKEARAFTLRAFRKGGRRPGQFSYHSFPLVDEVIKHLTNVGSNTVTAESIALTQTQTITGFEGRAALRTITVRERDPLLIYKAKDAFKQKHNRLFCEICKSDFF